MLNRYQVATEDHRSWLVWDSEAKDVLRDEDKAPMVYRYAEDAKWWADELNKGRTFQEIRTGTDEPEAESSTDDLQLSSEDQADTYYRDIAIAQAETLNKQAEQIRELIRERDRAESDREAAIDLAEQYARKAGIDVSEDDLISGVADYWRMRGEREAWVGKLETFHWDVLRTVNEIEQGLSRGVVGAEASGLAQRIADRLKAANPLSRDRRPKGPLLEQPRAPGL